jgi:transcriptional regulator with XRE-family HTH domain
MSHVGQEIRKIREARDLNQAQLAVLIGTGPAAISRIENGKQNPNSTTLVKIALALDVEVADLFPKGQATLPLDDLNEGVLAEQRRLLFAQHFSSEDELIQRIRRTVGIARGYADRWHSEWQRIEEEGTYPYGKSIEMGQLWEGFREAVESDGVYPYMRWVLTEEPEVSPAVHEVCCNLDDALSDMMNEIMLMRQVEDANKRRASEDVARGLEEFEKSLEEGRAR